MGTSKRAHEAVSDDDYGDDDLPDMSRGRTPVGPSDTEPTHRWSQGSTSYRPLYTSESVRSAVAKKPTHRPPCHHAKVRDRARPMDPRMHSNSLFDRRQLGSLALASLLELSNLGDRYESLKLTLRGVQSVGGQKDAREVNRIVGRWVEELLHCPPFPLRTYYSPVAEIFVTFLRAACDVNCKRDIVEALARLVQEDDRQGSTELVS